MQGRFDKTGLTFDDILLVPASSEVLPRETDVHTRVTAGLPLNIPLMTSAMDTVTEAAMAIAIAREGGMGVVHKNLSIEQQAAEVEKVKRYESGVVSQPITLSPHQRVADALKIMAQRKISGFPVVDKRKLVGIVTHRDLRFHENPAEKISALMVQHRRLVTAPEGISLERAKAILHKHRIEKLPLINKKGELTGLITIRDILNRIQYPNACVDGRGRLQVGAAVGTAADTLERVQALVKAGLDLVVVDTAHGHSSRVIAMVKAVKKRFPGLPVVGGNVATGEAARDLARAGADAIKVGIGPGSICTTRIVAGVGVPQITAIHDCYEALKETPLPLIADGGIRYSGDVAKAVAAGADVVMIGGLFAGTEESPGETILYEGRTYKSYRGMGSLGAMKEGSKDRYFQADVEEESKMIPEGIEGRVAYKGRVKDSVFQLIGGLKVAMGYCGARSLADLKKAKFIRITQAGMRESHPHDIQITKEAPNYRVEN